MATLPWGSGLNLTRCFHGPPLVLLENVPPLCQPSSTGPRLHTGIPLAAVVGGYLASDFHQKALTFSVPVSESVKWVFEQRLWDTSRGCPGAPALCAALSDLFFKATPWVDTPTPISWMEKFIHGEMQSPAGKEKRPALMSGSRPSIHSSSSLSPIGPQQPREMPGNLRGCQPYTGAPETKQSHFIILS